MGRFLQTLISYLSDAYDSLSQSDVIEPLLSPLGMELLAAALIALILVKAPLWIDVPVATAFGVVFVHNVAVFIS